MPSTFALLLPPRPFDVRPFQHLRETTRFCLHDRTSREDSSARDISQSSAIPLPASLALGLAHVIPEAFLDPRLLFLVQR